MTQSPKEPAKDWSPYISVLTVIVMKKDGHLSAENATQQIRGNISDKPIYRYDPVKMTEGFTRSLQKMSVPHSNSHYDLFCFK